MGAGVHAEEPVTRAGAVTSLTAGSIGLFLTNTDPDDTDPPYVPVSNRKYSYGTPKWTTDKVIYLGGEEANVCAYYPYSVDRTTATVALSTQNYDKTKDLSYAKNIRVNGGPDKTVDGNTGRFVTFVLERAYSRARFEFTRKNYAGTGQITKIELKKLPLSASLDMAAGTYSSLTTGEKALTVDYTLHATDATPVEEADELLVAPGKFAESTAADKEGLVLVLTIDDKTMTTYIKPSVLNELKAGKYYTFKVNVNGTGIEIEKVELENWEVKDIDNGGDEFETEPKTRISVLSAGIEVETSGLTRAATTSELKIGTLGLFLRGAAGTGYTDKNNLSYAYNAAKSEWQPTDAANTLYLGAKDASVCAYYPHNADAAYTDPTAIPLTSQVYTADAGNLSYATDRTMNGSGTNYKTSFTLKRAYAKLGFTFTRDNYPSTGALTQITLANCHTKNTVNIRTGTNGTANTVADLVNTVSLTIPADKSPVSTADGESGKNTMLVVPGTIPDYAGETGKGAEVILTVDGKQVRVLIPKNILGAWEAGKSYNIKIRLIGTSVTLETVEVKAWETTDITDDGDKPFVPEIQ